MPGSGILVIVLRRDALRGGVDAFQGLKRSFDALGIEPHFLHPDSRDPDASRYLYMSAEGLEDPDAKARSIAGSEYIEAAYYKPPDEPPVSPNDEKEAQHG